MLEDRVMGFIGVLLIVVAFLIWMTPDDWDES